MLLHFCKHLNRAEKFTICPLLDAFLFDLLLLVRYWVYGIHGVIIYSEVFHYVIDAHMRSNDEFLLLLHHLLFLIREEVRLFLLLFVKKVVLVGLMIK